MLWVSKDSTQNNIECFDYTLWGSKYVIFIRFTMYILIQSLIYNILQFKDSNNRHFELDYK